MFISECLLCLLSKTGNKIPGPLATTTDRIRPSQVIHFDYLNADNVNSGNQYILLVKDDLVAIAGLRPQRPLRQRKLHALQQDGIVYSHHLRYGLVTKEVILNETIRQMADEYKILHKPIPAHTPWANGTVERLNRDWIAAMRAKPAEAKLALQDWPYVLSTVQTVLNEAPLERIGRNADGSMRSPLRFLHIDQPMVHGFAFR